MAETKTRFVFFSLLLFSVSHFRSGHKKKNEAQLWRRAGSGHKLEETRFLRPLPFVIFPPYQIKGTHLTNPFFLFADRKEESVASRQATKVAEEEETEKKTPGIFTLHTSMLICCIDE